MSSAIQETEIHPAESMSSPVKKRKSEHQQSNDNGFVKPTVCFEKQTKCVQMNNKRYENIQGYFYCKNALAFKKLLESVCSCKSVEEINLLFYTESSGEEESNGGGVSESKVVVRIMTANSVNSQMIISTINSTVWSCSSLFTESLFINLDRTDLLENQCIHGYS